MTERMGLAAAGRQNRQRAALARRAELRPAARRLAAVAVGFAGGWAVLYGALMPFGLGFVLGFAEDCFAPCAAGAALGVLLHGFGALSLRSVCMLCALGAAVAARWMGARTLTPAALAGCGTLVGVALCFAFGEVTGDRRQGRMLLWAMSVIFVICVGVVMWAEVQGNPHLLALGADSSINMEGKESRFGVLVSSLFAVVTTAASCGAVIAMHDSFTALGGMVPMWLMQIGEVVFGGVGSGLYGMMLFVLLAVFIAGLMIGRTPEYLGKKIDVREMKLTALAILVTPTLVLMGAALAMMTDAGRSAMLNPGPHGFSEVLYAVSSAANNNGSAFAGLSANSPFWNCLLAFCMFVGRFGVIIPVMAIAGSLVSKKSQPASSGTLPTHGPLFVGLLIGTVLLVGALTFIPALALGPVAEYLS